MTPAIFAWLRCASRDARLVLRGSVMLRALTPRGRMPVDVDHAVLGDMTLEALVARVGALVAESELAIASTEVLWPESVTPGIRVMIAHASGPLQVDLTTNEAMSLPSAPIDIPEVGPILCARPEDLFGWKCHGLIEFGHGQWMAKDLYDLDVLLTDVALDAALLPGSIALAFSSRSAELSLLDDFLTRPTWGESRSGRRRWRALGKTIAVDDFAVVRERVRVRVTANLLAR